MERKTEDRESPHLVDVHGRVMRYLRISVTDRCNLNCRYCRTEKTPFIPHGDILRFEEIETIIGIAAGFGVHKVRFTGGEPFARRGFLEFLERLHERHPGLGLRLTSNGTMLGGDVLPRLRAMGASINLSLDTLDRQTYAAITGRDALPDVLTALERILALGIPLKINAVAMRGVNDHQLPALAALAMEHPVDVRFIEFMPIGGESIWSNDLFWPGADILAAARRHWTLVPNEVRRGGTLRELSEAAEEHGPARLWKLRDSEGRLSQGSFGLISAVTHDFCRSCNRLRLTAEGNLRTCLYDDREYPLRDILRGTPPGERAQAVARVMAEAVAQKPVGSELLARRSGPVANKAMSAIGG